MSTARSGISGDLGFSFGISETGIMKGPVGQWCSFAAERKIKRCGVRAQYRQGVNVR